MKGRITVQVSTGDTFRTAWREHTADTVAEVRDFLSRVSEAVKFDIETDKGYTVHTNPSHVVYAYLETKEDTDGD